MSLIYTSSSGSGGRRHGVYLGGKREAKSLDKLQQWGISHILNVTPTKEASVKAGVPNYFEKSSTSSSSSSNPSTAANNNNNKQHNKQLLFVYKRIPIYDASTSVTELEQSANDIITFISNGLHHGSVLVHCHQGISRSTTCVLLYLIRKVQLSLPDALAMVQRRRLNAQPIPAFMNWLRREEKKLVQQQQQQQQQEESSSASVLHKGDTNNYNNNNKKTSTVSRKPIGPSTMIGPAVPPKDQKSSSNNNNNSNNKRTSEEQEEESNNFIVEQTNGSVKRLKLVTEDAPSMIGPSLPPSTTTTTTTTTVTPTTSTLPSLLKMPVSSSPSVFVPSSTSAPAPPSTFSFGPQPTRANADEQQQALLASLLMAPGPLVANADEQRQALLASLLRVPEPRKKKATTSTTTSSGRPSFFPMNKSQSMGSIPSLYHNINSSSSSSNSGGHHFYTPHVPLNRPPSPVRDPMGQASLSMLGRSTSTPMFWDTSTATTTMTMMNTRTTVPGGADSSAATAAAAITTTRIVDASMPPAPPSFP